MLLKWELILLYQENRGFYMSYNDLIDSSMFNATFYVGKLSC
jgi:hypothetical protein